MTHRREQNGSRISLVLALSAATLALGGCVERSLTVRSEPAGAVVVVNDEEIGASPAKFSFVWYGDYEIILRKPGFETLTTFHRVPAPWWQFPPFDFVAEILVPGTIQDARETPVYVMAPRAEPSVPELMENAEKTRAEAGSK
ncbi:MAG: PEGA domain-containing protein [Phycisphaerales bacterium]|nr:PEGA domain-containing protein [Phycisphaerales bacterium]